MISLTARMHLKGHDYSPALRMNLFSVTSHRGCGGGCSFCSIQVHQGKKVISRSVESITKEIRGLSKHPEWKGYISDIGGATAEMYGNDCETEPCFKPSCLYPSQCGVFSPGKRYLELLRECRKLPGVKKIFLGSGIRYDILLHNPELLEEILLHHSGRFLRIAPEHTEDHVLNLMRKPSFETLESFVSLFNSINRKLKRKTRAGALPHRGSSRREACPRSGDEKEARLPENEIHGCADLHSNSRHPFHCHVLRRVRPFLQTHSC